MSEKIKHPSFANLYIGRSQCSGQKALFGSSIKHHDTITLKIFPAFIDRDLNMDRYFPEARPYIEIEMSQSQFAQAITSLNMGAGVPVTLRRLHDQYIEPCPFVDKREQFNSEFREDMNALTRKLTEATKHVEKLIEEKRTFNKADKDQILSALKSVTSQLASHYPYMYSMFNEQMDKTVTEAKAEIESHLQARMEDMALKVAGQEMKASEMLPDEESDIEEEGGMLMGGM